MFLRYSFDIRLESVAYEHVLGGLLKNSRLNHAFKKETGVFYFYLEGEQADIEHFVESVAARIPLSMLYVFKEVVQTEDFEGADYVLPSPQTYEYACTDCVLAIDEQSDPSKSCPTCYPDPELKAVRLEKDGRSQTFSQDFLPLFESLADSIAEGKIVKLQTFTGTCFLGSLTEENFEKIGKTGEIMGMDLPSIEPLTFNTEHELLMMAAYEKPKARLKTNPLFRREHPFVDRFEFLFGIPGERITYLLAKQLSARQVPYVFLNGESDSYDASCTLEGVAERPNKPALEIIILDKKDYVFVNYDRLLPLGIDVVLNEGSKSFGGYEAISDGKGRVELKLSGESDLELDFKSASVQSVLNDCNPEADGIGFVCFNKHTPDLIFAESKKLGLSQQTHVIFPDKPGTILDQIAAMDETGARLIQNFEKEDTERFAKIKGHPGFPDKQDNAYSFWAYIALILGIGEGDTLDRLAQNVLDNHYEFLGPRGPKIDHKLIKDEQGRYVMDYLNAIRSGMVYRLADMDDPVLSYGFFESYIDFVNQCIMDFTINLNVSDIVISGDLLAYRDFTQKIYQNHSSMTRYIQKKLPVVGPNIAFGALALDS